MYYYEHCECCEHYTDSIQQKSFVCTNTLSNQFAYNVPTDAVFAMQELSYGIVIQDASTAKFTIETCRPRGFLKSDEIGEKLSFGDTAVVFFVD